MEKLKAANANLEQRKEELVKELEQVFKPLIGSQATRTKSNFFKRIMNSEQGSVN